MSGVREALCPTLFPADIHACSSSGPVPFAKGVYTLPGAGIFASDRAQKVSVRAQHRQTKPARFACKPHTLSPPFSAQFARDAEGLSLADGDVGPVPSVALDATELDILEQTLHGEGEIVRKYPPPQYSMFQNFDAVHQVAEEPDRFFGEFMGHAAIPPVDLGEIDQITYDRMRSCDDAVLIYTDVASADIREAPRERFQEYSHNVSIGTACLPKECEGAPCPPPSVSMPCPELQISSPCSLSDSDGISGQPQESGSILPDISPSESTAKSGGPSSRAHNGSRRMSLFQKSAANSPTLLQAPLTVTPGSPMTTKMLLVGKVSSTSIAISKSSLHGSTQHANCATIVSPLTTQTQSASQAARSSAIPSCDLRNFANPTITMMPMHEVSLSSPSNASLDQEANGAAPDLKKHEVCTTAGPREDFDGLPQELKVKIFALRTKIAGMPRRKLRDSLARDVTLEEIEPLMVVNRDDLAAMLALGVTTWKSFLHQELGVSRWPARALKSIDNKSRDAYMRLEEAMRDGAAEETASARLDIAKLVKQKEILMQQLRVEAQRYKTEQAGMQAWESLTFGKRRRV
jgi:hypothetical protein